MKHRFVVKIVLLFFLFVTLFVDFCQGALDDQNFCDDDDAGMKLSFGGAEISCDSEVSTSAAKEKPSIQYDEAIQVIIQDSRFYYASS